jgi:MoxR-like ATPase
MATRDPVGWQVPDIAAHVGLGASPRATLGLLAAGRALALVRGRRFLIPQDVADVAPEILRHRLILTYDALADGVTTDDVISRIIATMPVPQVTPRQESGLQDTA